jgi:hypothetical protein
MTHAQLVKVAEQWLRRYRCGIVLSEQQCCSGEMPDAIGWKSKCRSVVVECKVSRADFLADRSKAWRTDPNIALGSERLYLSPRGIVRVQDLAKGWGLLEYHNRQVKLLVKPSRVSLRTPEGLMNEMNLLLSSLRRVEVRIEPQTITEFLKWKNRMAEYNGGMTPEGIVSTQLESNGYLSPELITSDTVT